MIEVNDGAFVVTDDIEIHPAALIMPPMNETEFKEFKEDISGNGLIEPIILFQGKVLDGRNRYNACKDLDIEVWAREWEGGMDPVEYVVSKNIHRRQLTPGQRAAAAAKAMDYHVAEAKERQRDAGRGTHNNQHTKSLAEKMVEEGLSNGELVKCHECGDIHGSKVSCPGCLQLSVLGDGPAKRDKRATSEAGKLFNVSGASVSRAKTILEHGTDEEKQSLESGQSPIKPLAKKVQERIKNSPSLKPTFNKTTDSVEWAKWTWNPVTGCRQGCEYCYAKDITKRYPEGFPNGFEPTFLEYRLDAVLNTKLPARKDQGYRNVFVCSMADLFGEWVDSEWIEKVISACSDGPEWMFIFLTKNPKRLLDFTFPKNSWVGATVDIQDRVDTTVEVFEKLRLSDSCPSGLFLSCEPMLERLEFGEGSLRCFDLIIIGGCRPSSGFSARQPDFEWVWRLTNQAEKETGKFPYWKTNLKCRPQEYPGW